MLNKLNFCCLLFVICLNNLPMRIQIEVIHNSIDGINRKETLNKMYFDGDENINININIDNIDMKQDNQVNNLL